MNSTDMKPLDTSQGEKGQPTIRQSISEMHSVRALVESIVPAQGTYCSLMDEEFAEANSAWAYDLFLESVSSELVDKISNFVRQNGCFCFDIGCGYMEVGRRLAHDFGIGYVGVDIIDHINGNRQTPPLSENERFIQSDIFHTLRQIGTGKVPLVLVNNFDPDTFIIDRSCTKIAAQSAMYAEIRRILVPGGYLLALGTTTMLLDSQKLPEELEEFDMGDYFDNIPIFRKPE